VPRSGKAGQKAFLKAYATCGQITKAAKSAGVDRGAHYDWLLTPGYAGKFAAAQEQATEWLEDEATRRASEGVVEAVFYQGKPIGTRRVYSDGLAMFLLRGLKPGKYRTNALEISGPGGGPIPLEQQRLATLTDDELAALIATAQKLAAAGTDAGGTEATGQK
jgi:hypothetical protein